METLSLGFVFALQKSYEISSWTFPNHVGSRGEQNDQTGIGTIEYPTFTSGYYPKPAYPR